MPDPESPLLLGASPEEAKVFCIVLHGRTQTPEDMEEQVVGRLHAPDTAFLLPRAPGRSWYAARAVDPLTAQTKTELEAAVARVHALRADWERRAGREMPLLIAGFSQGACLSLEYAMRHGPWRGALACLTGCRVGPATPEQPFADLDRMPVYLTGSDKDPWIPVDAFSAAAATLAQARARLRCEVFPDRAHEVCREEVLVLDQMIESLAQGSEVFETTGR